MAAFPEVGERFGRYSIVSQLGSGGMGVVFEATDEVLGRTIALKVMSPFQSSDADFRVRFQHEAALLARLDSPHIVHIFDFGELDGCLFMATQLVPDGDLHALIRRQGRLPAAQSLELVAQVCEGLIDAHEAGVVHRDVKPSNVLVRRRLSRVQSLICDFGIATAGDLDSTRSGFVVGSPAYMAPERAQGEPADERTDIYSLGCVLWTCLTGSSPYAGPPSTLAEAHRTRPVPQLPDLDPFADGVNRLLMRALAKTPIERFSTAREFAEAIDEVRSSANAGAPDEADTTLIRPSAPDTGSAPPLDVPAEDVTIFGERTILAVPTTEGLDAAVTELTPRTAGGGTPTRRPVFTPRQVDAVEAEIARAEAKTDSAWSVYFGSTEGDPRRFARTLHAGLDEPTRSVLLLVDPARRALEVVTGSGTRSWLSDDEAATAVRGMVGFLARGEMTLALVNGIRSLARRHGA